MQKAVAYEKSLCAEAEQECEVLKANIKQLEIDLDNGLKEEKK